MCCVLTICLEWFGDPDTGWKNEELHEHGKKGKLFVRALHALRMRAFSSLIKFDLEDPQ